MTVAFEKYDGLKKITAERFEITRNNFIYISRELPVPLNHINQTNIVQSYDICSALVC